MAAGVTESSWLKDGVEAIERVVTKSMIVKPEIFELKMEKPGTYAIVTPAPAGGQVKVEKIVAGPVWHNERLETPLELHEFVGSLKEARKLANEKGVFYVGAEKVTYHYDFDDRRDRATVQLVESKPYKLLKAGINQKQRDFIRTLRIDFAGCLPPTSTFINRLRKVEHRLGTTNSGTVEKGSEAMHRAVNAAIENKDDLPDEITLTLNLFENFPQCRVAVQCAIEYDVMNTPPVFELIPFPNELQKGLETTLRELKSLLEDTGVPAFLGTSSAGN